MGGKGTLFYNASASALPKGAKPQLRAGRNRWEALLTRDMRPAEGLDLPVADWWSVELEFDEVCTTLISLSICVPTYKLTLHRNTHVTIRQNMPSMMSNIQ